MTDLGGFGAFPRRERTKVQAEAASASTQTPKGEVFEESGSLVGTFWLPLHDPSDVKFHVGRRTITVWSRREGREFQTILVLPRWVNPETFVLAHHNGLYEFALEPAAEPPAAA